jgi:hypothetical protein
MRVPAIVPVLTGQTPPTVSLVVHDIVRRIKELPFDNTWRTRLWLASKALQWLHFNAAGFIDAGGAGEGAQRRLFHLVWDTVRFQLSYDDVDELRRFSLATATPTRWTEPYANVLSHSHQVPTAQWTQRMKDTMDMYNAIRADKSMTDHQREVWRTLVVAATFDIIVANVHTMPAASSFFRDTVHRKWQELGQQWPFFQQVYPMEAVFCGACALPNK